MSEHENDRHPTWEEIARIKRAKRDDAIPLQWRLSINQVPDSRLNVIGVPAECGILTARETAITETDATVLVKKLVARDYTSREVTLAFCKRAAIAQQLVNCLAEIFFQTALQAAKRLDANYAATGVPSGPLHGLPVSLKDCFKIEGMDAAIGYTALAGQVTPQGEESEMTSIMRQCGAILFCKTSVPLALMAGETFSAIYGYTLNPHNRSLSSGGSSGGESALIALRGSPLGVGTDIGGSIRIPASFCGLYSLKPSFGRFPTYGMQDGLEGLESVRNAVGPMATSIAAVKMWSKVVVESEPWMADPGCLYIPWRHVELPEKLCIGILVDDGIVKPLPPITRALQQTREALEAAGHVIIEFHIDDPLYTDNLKHALYRSAAAEVLHSNLLPTKEPWPRGYEVLGDIVAKTAMPTKVCEGQTPSTGVGPVTVRELWEAQSKRTAYAKKMLSVWAATKTRSGTGREMDALLMPCTPWPACSKYKFTYDNYTSLWNVLDYCATTLPVTHVSIYKDIKPEYEGRNQVETNIWNDYSPESMAGCPVAVQLVGRRLNEESLLEITRVCDDVLRAGNDSQ